MTWCNAGLCCVVCYLLQNENSNFVLFRRRKNRIFRSLVFVKLKQSCACRALPMKSEQSRALPQTTITLPSNISNTALMALTGDVYAKDSSSEEAEEMEEKQQSKDTYAAASNESPIVAAVADDDNGDNIDEHVKLTETILKEHNEQMDNIESSSSTSQHIITDEREAAVSSAGAGLLFGFSGLLLGGPILGTIAGVSAAIVASNDHGPVGNNARAAGNFAMSTGSKVGEVARDVDEKHGIIERIQHAWAEGWGKVKQFDEEHHTSESIKETMSNVSDKVVGFEKEHHFFENLLEGIHKGVQFLLEKVKSATSEYDNGEVRG
jgi:hypothetical protein